MTAGTLDLTGDLGIEKGATYRIQLRLRNPPVAPATVGTLMDLSLRTARMQVRATVDDPVVLLELTTEDGGLTLGGAAGTVDLLVEADASAAFTWTKGKYDLEVVDESRTPPEVVRVIKGRITADPEVTRETAP